MGLGCPHIGIEFGGVSRCDLVDEFAKKGINILQLDRVFGRMDLAVNGGGDNMTCGMAALQDYTRCVGANIPRDKFSLLEKAMRDRMILDLVENKVFWRE
jgi:hypothetical protein